jgi:hypothetical protein
MVGPPRDMDNRAAGNHVNIRTLRVVGPFYCPQVQKLNIDLDSYLELRDRFHAPGDFAQADVIAHEVGHHVQTLLGISKQVHEARLCGANASSVRLELKANCFAGVWANHANKMASFANATRSPPRSDEICSRSAAGVTSNSPCHSGISDLPIVD